ncbi:uncharacterized protein ACNLHF_026983 isoform 1-T3 [Anomaloglossus baeobatrachus]
MENITCPLCRHINTTSKYLLPAYLEDVLEIKVITINPNMHYQPPMTVFARGTWRKPVFHSGEALPAVIQEQNMSVTPGGDTAAAGHSGRGSTVPSFLSADLSCTLFLLNLLHISGQSAQSRDILKDTCWVIPSTITQTEKWIVII